MFKSVVFGLGVVCLVASTAPAALAVTLSFETSSATLMEEFTGDKFFVSSFNGNGVTVAESFQGLTVNDPFGTGFENFSGSPTNPLTLDIGTATDGLRVGDDSRPLTRGTVSGLATGSVLDDEIPLGDVIPLTDIGEGVVAMLFDADIFELGLTLRGADPNSGTTTFYFYDQTGVLLGGTAITTDLAGFPEGFRTIDLTFTSALAFRGVAIENTDFGGQNYDNLRFDFAAIPEPGTLAIFGLGLAGLGFMNRRRKLT